MKWILFGISLVRKKNGTFHCKTIWKKEGQEREEKNGKLHFYCHFDWKVWIHYCSTVENDGNWFHFIFDTYNTGMNCFELCPAFVQQNSIFNSIVKLNTVQMNYNGYRWINRVQFINISKTSGKNTNIMENGFSFKEMRIEREKKHQQIYERWTREHKKWWKKRWACTRSMQRREKNAIIHTIQIEQVLNSELKSEKKLWRL